MATKPSSSNNYEQLHCPDCEIYLEEIQKLKKEIDKLSKSLQIVQTEATRMEIVLQENGLYDNTQDVSDQEAICVEQIKRLKEVSALRALTETESKILDILHKNLRMSRGEIVDKENNKKVKKASVAELLSLVKEE